VAISFVVFVYGTFAIRIHRSLKRELHLRTQKMIDSFSIVGEAFISPIVLSVQYTRFQIALITRVAVHMFHVDERHHPLSTLYAVPLRMRGQMSAILKNRIVSQQND
jgi:hypothetical protein